MIDVICTYCGKSFKAYNSSKRKYCSKDCNYRGQSREFNPDGYILRPLLTKMNKEINHLRMTPDIKAKLTLLRMGTGLKKSYLKLNGRHLHRQIAEMILGRTLKKGEIVHHKDGNKRNNNPENIVVMPSQREHASLHYKDRRLTNELKRFT